ncbi:MAG: cob(I)yrinic acid a,c-diamide adenosyltransferase [Thermacetogeniaceae bacterium]|jgi:cob(I)alamin adenosyltransferase
MNKPRLERGLIQVYTGDSKGKTTAALGLVLRAVGHGFCACMIQFLKGGAYTGELFAAQRLYPNFTIRQYGITCPYSALIRQGEAECKGCGQCFMEKGKVTEENLNLAHLAFKAAEEAVCSGEYDIVILDEINHAFHFGLLPVADALALLAKKPEHVEVIMTGRNAPPEIIAAANLVTEMSVVKHPFQKGIKSRRGIEY